MIRCELGKHPMKRTDEYVYWDAANGIIDPIHVCHICLLEHVERYYGNCPNSKSIRAYHQLPKYEEITNATT